MLDFDEFCNDNGFVSIYYRIPQQSLHLYKDLGKRSFPLGEEAIVDLSVFNLDGGKIKTTRSAINRLTSEGFKSANLGLAPLSGIEGTNLAEKTISYAYENLKAFDHFKGLKKYKEKFFLNGRKNILFTIMTSTCYRFPML